MIGNAREHSGAHGNLRDETSKKHIGRLFQNLGDLTERLRGRPTSVIDCRGPD
jgi:hypothetical protein